MKLKILKFRILRLFNHKYSLVRQYDSRDCGPAALLSVLKYYKGEASLSHIREITDTGINGSTMFGLMKGAKLLGFEARGVTGNYEDLFKEHMPCIAHVILKDMHHHYVVIYKIYSDSVLIGDPAKGLCMLGKSELLDIWKKKAILLLKPTGKVYRDKYQSVYGWILQYLIREKSWIYQVIFLGSIYTSIGLLTAVFIQFLIDRFIIEENFIKIIATGIFLFFLLTIRASASYYRQRFFVILYKKLNMRINDDFLSHLFQLPKKFFDTHKIGDIIARLNDTRKIQEAIIIVVGSLIIDILIIIGSFIVLLYFSRILAFITIVFIISYGVILALSMINIKIQQHEVMKSYAQVESMYIDSLTGIDDILSFSVSTVYYKLNLIINNFFQNHIEKLGYSRSRLLLSSELFTVIIIIGVLIVGALLVIEKNLLLGEMVASYSLIANIIPAVNSLVNSNISILGAAVASRRLMDLRLIETEKNCGRRSFSMQKSLVIKNGYFSWTKTEHLLRNINMVIKKGKIIALFGPNGGGKSTIVQILQRKYYLSQGRILIDDTSITEFDLYDYRKHIAVVPTRIKIFNASLADNILLGRYIKSIDYLREKLDFYGMWEFTERFKDGIYTLLGEQGRICSAGEKQLIALSRAVINSPDILILDEGFNTIDIQTTDRIFEILIRYAKKNAILIISHNLKALTRADYLYVLKDGIIFQEGTPQELIDHYGYFQNMWELYKRV